MSDCGYGGCGDGAGPKNPKIYVFPTHANPIGDCGYMAVAEDGEEVAFHVSSSPEYGRLDMGVNPTSQRKHDLYRKKYPGGYTLEWVPDWKTHSFLSKQAAANEFRGVDCPECEKV
jgi:hypothetical protein